MAGTTVYVDPTGAAGTGASTADTRNTLPSPLVAGRQYLIKEGTTLTQSVSTSVVATAPNPIVIGVYRTGT
ncbi:MAG: hypothetical protein NTW47_03360, partial [Proteobacteria bacterium]|nr:hypothetical protein [Pseudomonadota bacterium]